VSTCYFPELWLPIPMTDGKYQASSLGNIRRNPSLPRFRKSTIHPHELNSGYLFAAVLFPDGRFRGATIHRLVADAFLGPRPEGMVINHKDGNKHNNRYENLEYVSYKDNMAHAREMGLADNRGNRNGQAKLTADDAIAIRQAYSVGNVTQAELAARYGVSSAAVWKVINRVKWKHV
jgi:predicted DNA-binding protein (UPF0251 family)